MTEEPKPFGAGITGGKKWYQKEVRYQGTPVRCRVPVEVNAALAEKARKMQRSTSVGAGVALEEWYELQQNLKPEVSEALAEEAERCKMGVPRLMAILMSYWYEDSYLPSRRKGA